MKKFIITEEEKKEIIGLYEGNIKIDKDERIKLTNNKDFLLVIPLTTNASCKYGATTKWCVSGMKDNPFDNYNKMCWTLGMVMIKNPEIQELFGTRKFAINVYNKFLEVHGEDSTYLKNFPKKIMDSGLYDEVKQVFNDFIQYHNNKCQNKVDVDYFDNNIMNQNN